MARIIKCNCLYLDKKLTGPDAKTPAMPKKRSLPPLIPVCLLFLFSACASGDNSLLASHYSEQVIDSGLRLGNNCMPCKALQLVNAHFGSLRKMSVMDRYRYYRFHFDLFFSYYSTAYD